MGVWVCAFLVASWIKRRRGHAVEETTYRDYSDSGMNFNWADSQDLPLEDRYEGRG